MIEVSGLVKAYGDGSSAVQAVSGVSFEVQTGSLVSLLGPSGCGKTTTMRLLAGLERPTAGEITIGGKLVASPERGVFTPVHRRSIGMVFQSYAVWPHMTVGSNVAFPLKVERPRLRKSEITRRVTDVLQLVGLGHLADRPATALSGGQQQRVALARALVRQPTLLLLDEPLSNLDAGLREVMREEIRDLQQRLGITTVFVTHDRAEALAISDEVIVMNDGLIVEQGLPQEIYSWPRSAFTAGFLGVSNRFDGSIGDITGGVTTVETRHGPLRCPAKPEGRVGDPVSVFLRPEAFAVSRSTADAQAWTGTVRFSIYNGDSWDYHVEIGGEVVKVRAYREKIGLTRGDVVHIVADGGAAIVIDNANGDVALPGGANPIALEGADL
jgi:iron(III) transport system ATP-binding protein